MKGEGKLKVKSEKLNLNDRKEHQRTSHKNTKKEHKRFVGAGGE